MFLAALAAGLVTTSAPLVHPVCEATGYRLLLAVDQGWISNERAAVVFRDCQIRNPILKDQR